MRVGDDRQRQRSLKRLSRRGQDQERLLVP
jgi:hypothetical protein